MDESKPNTSLELEIRNHGLGVIKLATGLEAVDQESANIISSMAAALKSDIKRWKEYWKPHKDRANAVVQGLRDSENEFLKRAEPVVLQLSNTLGAWTLAERERVRREQEARDKAEWEANQKAREADEKLEGVVNFEEAAAIVEEAKPDAPLPQVVKSQLAELQPRDHWVSEVEDLDKVPRRFMKLDDVEVGRHVTLYKERALPGGDAQIPGIKVFNRPIMAAKRRSV